MARLAPGQFNEIEQAADRAICAIDDVLSYLSDLIVESQNSLLGGLFPTLPLRQPIVSKHKVITQANEAELENYFNRETEYGRRCQRLIRELSEKGREEIKAP
jgi:hypothetical protein